MTKTVRQKVLIQIVHYPGAMLSAVQGLSELFYLANGICREQGVAVEFRTDIKPLDQLDEGGVLDELAQVVILPPCLGDQYHRPADKKLINWLQSQHQRGTILSSVCAGAFVLAETGLLNGRQATTHWALSDQFTSAFPHVGLDCNKILINDNDVITAGGLMSWVDLGLELVAQYTRPQIMRALGRYLIVDTAPREQRYYLSFQPRLDHGDKAIVKVQHYLQEHYYEPQLVRDMARYCHLSERTFLRRFVKATGLKPKEYLQQLRIQKACELIEANQENFTYIAARVGYEDLSAFRKIFVKITGQTPKVFKERFVGHL